MTNRSFQKLFSEHRDYPKRDEVTEPQCFKLEGPFKFETLEKVKSKDPFVLKARE